LKKVDLKGVFQGVVYINKKDYALELLEKGLAISMGGRYANKRYEEAEAIARKNKTGLWAQNLNLSSIKG
jgi:endonuclease YncB( thermonuclease family)